MTRTRFIVLAALAAALALPGVAAAQVDPPDAVFEDVLKIDYFDNANTSGAPDAKVRITNAGSTEGFVGTNPIVPADLCAMVYVFRPDQQMAACCGCKVTHNGYIKLSVNNNLTNNPLTAEALPAGAIKILSTLPGTAVGPNGSSPECNPADATALERTVPGIKAWATHPQETGSWPEYTITETPFTNAFLSFSELNTLFLNCELIIGNLVPPGLGSGKGLCSCPDEGSNTPGIDPAGITIPR